MLWFFNRKNRADYDSNSGTRKTEKEINADLKKQIEELTAANRDSHKLVHHLTARIHQLVNEKEALEKKTKQLESDVEQQARLINFYACRAPQDFFH